MEDGSKKKPEFFKTVFAIFLTATFLILIILVLSFLGRNGTLTRIKENFLTWQAEQREKKNRKEDGEPTVTYIGKSGISEYESWFLYGEAVFHPEQTEPITPPEDPTDLNEVSFPEREERKKLTESPVKGNEEWWKNAIKLTNETLLYAQADTPLYAAPEERAAVVSTTGALECLRLVAIIKENWYVVTDGLWFYCSEGTRYTLVKPETIDFAEYLKTRKFKKVKHVVSLISQYPELPHGCEVTALSMLLEYYGVKKDKCDISDKWLPKGEWGTTDFNKAFIGNPKTTKRSAGCYAPVIAETANRVLREAGKSLTATAVSGLTFDELLNRVTNNPVIVWTTMKLEAPYIAQVFNVDGKELLWQNQEHSIVLTGYDTERGVLFGMDPMYGECEYEMRLFSLRFSTMFSQIVEIK